MAVAVDTIMVDMYADSSSLMLLRTVVVVAAVLVAAVVSCQMNYSQCYLRCPANPYVRVILYYHGIASHTGQA